MKKIISLSILLVTAISCVIIAVSVTNTPSKLILITSDVTFKFGTYKVSKLKTERYYGGYNVLNFEVKSPSDFYNDFIKNSDYYKSDLDFETKDLFAYGFLAYDEYLVAYEIGKHGKVEIYCPSGTYSVNDPNISDSQYGANPVKEWYYFYGPFDQQISTYDIVSERDDEHPHDSCFSNHEYEDLSFENFTKLIQYYDTDFYQYKDDCYYLRGRISSEDGVTYSEEFILKVYEKDGIARIDVCE